LEFDDGITAVVGPNGSGKSNIADAVRWVLGEQSTRALRGGKMEDVIFNGTQHRRPLGVAAVTLMMDNTDRMLAVDADEVAVTRRLYRSGESEYRINGALVRLRDINELFMDTGLGRDGYSIIGQGRIAEMVSGRAQDRREIFEEAAGISKFRYRKIEAERRLAMAEENMVRLRDILSELDGRVGPLREQSEKAKKFLLFSEEKKVLEVSVWMQNLSVLRIKAMEAEDRLLLTATQHGQAEQETAKYEAALDAEVQNTRQLSIEIEESRSKKSELLRSAGELDANKALLENDIGHHQKTIEQTLHSIEQAGRSREQTTADIDRCTREIFEKQAEITFLKEKIENIETQRTELDDKQSKRAAQLEKLRLHRAGFFEAIEKERLKAAASTTVLGESETQRETLQTAFRRQSEVLEELQREISENEEFLEDINGSITSLTNVANGYAIKRDAGKARLAGLGSALETVERQIDAMRQRALVLTEMEKNLEGFGQSVKTVMKRVKTGLFKGVHGPVSALLQVNSAEHTLAVETALGGALQHIVVDNEETAKRAINLLKQEQAGRATFLPQTSVSGSRMGSKPFELMDGYIGLAIDLITTEAEYSGIMGFLLGRVAVARDIDCAVAIAKSQGYRLRVVSLDGQVVHAGGSMTGGSSTHSTGLLSRRDEISRLNEQIAVFKKKQKDAEETKRSAEAELLAVEAELGAVEAERQTLTEDRIRCETELTQLRKSFAAAEGSLQNISNSQKTLERRMQEVAQQSQSAAEILKTLEKELEDAQGEIAKAVELQECDARSAALLTEEFSEHNTRLALLTRDEESLQEETGRLVLQRDSNEHLSEQLTNSRTQLEEEIRKAKHDIEVCLAKAEEFRAQAEQTEIKIKQHMAERNESERRAVQIRAEIQEQTAQRDGLYRETVRLEEQKKALDAELTAVVTRLYDEYELTRTAAEELAKPIEDTAAANRRLNELRGKIRVLGAVNVAAIEEYQEVYERHAVLTAQIADIEHAKKQLTALIFDLTSSMRTIFSDRFARINRHFGEIFAQLFGGGSASLSLSDPNDVLESGIEIHARPPGKIIKNLASLSGGEESLVAIAIFFSILKVNPAPFCLLDEIEAALDDVNVVRFADFLRIMSDKTQFIAMTHRRGTMEEADVLYGVTMQEEGVSRLLELKVSELEREHTAP
jgi:chromosome segregation protein